MQSTGTDNFEKMYVLISLAGALKQNHNLYTIFSCIIHRTTALFRKLKMFLSLANLQLFNRRINIYIIFWLLTEGVDTLSHRLFVWFILFQISVLLSASCVC